MLTALVAEEVSEVLGAAGAASAAPAIFTPSPFPGKLQNIACVSARPEDL